MKISLVALALSLVLAMENAAAREFIEGQIWAYKTRKGEGISTLLINKVENDKKVGTIFHITVYGVRVKKPRDPEGITTELPHFPVSQTTLEESCTKLIGTAPPRSGYEAGYAEWRAAFEKGAAGIFIIPVAEIINIVEAAYNQPPK